MERRQFGYWRELLFMLFMLTVLILDITFFDILSPFGDEGARTSATTTAVH